VARIPDRLADDVQSDAERRLFERLRDETSDTITAFHGVAWLVPSRGKPRQGEADFVLAHPKHGVVALEVKGGTIRFDAAEGTWTSSGRDGEVKIKDPVKQAQSASHRLRELLERAQRDGAENISFGYGVAFPSARVDMRQLRADTPREIVVDHADLRSLDTRLHALFGYWHDRSSQPPLGETGIKRLERVLANSFELRAPLAHDLAEEQRQLLRLTEEQYRVLDLLARHPRAAIAGCAGSGKTFLAAEKARRLAAQGFRVLMLAYNVLLAQHLRRGLAEVEGVDVFAFDDLCRAVVAEAGVELADEPVSGEEHVYYRRLRELFAEHIDVAAGRYSALVVDEAQDFDPDWWVPLQLLLEDPDRSPLYVFFDSNQRLFPVPQGLPVPDEPFQLTVNCRNTKRINRLVSEFYDGELADALGPEGVPIEHHVYDTDEQLLEQLDTAVRAWVNDAQVRPEDIALLSAHSAERSVLWRVDRLGGVLLTDDPWESGKVLRSSIHRFKGLERLVVGVAELDGASERALYVGFSRPSVFLSVFCPRKTLRRLPRQLLAA
jgi:hypothetical protein